MILGNRRDTEGISGCPYSLNVEKEEGKRLRFFQGSIYELIEKSVRIRLTQKYVQ